MNGRGASTNITGGGGTIHKQTAATQVLPEQKKEAGARPAQGEFKACEKQQPKDSRKSQNLSGNATSFAKCVQNALDPTPSGG